MNASIITLDQVSVGAAHAPLFKNIRPFLLKFRESMPGVVMPPSIMHSDDSTYMGQCTSDPKQGDVSDYESD